MSIASPPPAPWRAWLLVLVAFWACLAPSWAASAAFVPAAADPFDDAPRACARAENSHLGFFGDLAKTHPENTPQVAKPHQEAEAAGRKTTSAGIDGSNSDPASLHKYLYAHANPVSGWDPSGHMFLAELTAAKAAQGLLIGMAAVSAYYFFQHTLQQLTAPLAASAGYQIQNAVDRLQAGFSAVMAGSGAQAIPVTEAKSRADATAQVEQLTKRDGYRAFAHGTATGAWADLRGDNPSIDGSKGGGQFGTGFYTFDAMSVSGISSAIFWAEGAAGGYGGLPIVGIFAMGASEYQALNKLHVPGGGTPPFIPGTELTGYDVVWGPLAGSIGSRLSDQYKFEGGGISRLRFVGAVVLPAP